MDSMLHRYFDALDLKTVARMRRAAMALDKGKFMRTENIKAARRVLAEVKSYRLQRRLLAESGDE